MNPLVSVYCLAYNHEKYIQNALEGFVSQKTNFPYEVFVHDDASKDQTPNIILEYAKKYPHIIKPIIQKENQYSKKIPIIKTYIAPLMKGKYIAICEGDDYWCDENKLQRQVDWLETNPDYSFCVHNTKLIDIQSGDERYFNNNIEDKDITVEEVLQGGGAHFHTSSFMYRAEYLNMPEEFKIHAIGDYPRSIYLALCGKVRYLHNIMSVYRMNVEGSYTRRFTAASLEVRRHKNEQVIQMLKNVDVYTKGQYTEYIAKLIHQKEFSLLLDEGKIREIKKEYYDMYSTLSMKVKIKVFLKNTFPHIIRLYHKFTL